MSLLQTLSLYCMKARLWRTVEVQVYGTLLLINIQEDVKIIKEMGLDAYRISFSWSRILPKGKLRAGANWKGIRYYNHLINELIHNGSHS
ncbi:putative beta-glucosidase 9 [Silene latifolia]|uniref:putative beta-glucosidase 9 n=1 Tax=Silene latifolia TaxID=37657 RepID=UPI003D77A948